MMPDIPPLGVRFDIEKVGGGSYGFAAWKVFWGAVDPETIRSSSLFEGDTDATLKGRENVYCIAVQCFDTEILDRIKAALGANDKFLQVAASPRFAEGNACAREPLPDAGRRREPLSASLVPLLRWESVEGRLRQFESRV